jgi:signal transduction histidine kinase
MKNGQPFSRRWGAIAATGAMLVGLLALNAAAIREIVAARDDARRMAQRELQLRLEELGQSYRVHLGKLRIDLIALAESPPLQRLPERLVSEDPLVQRWARLDAQGSLALFAQSHPALSELWLSTEVTEDPVRVGRVNGVVVILDPREAAPPAGDKITAMRAALPSRRDAWIRAWVDLSLVLGEEGDADLEGLTVEAMAPEETESPGLVAAVEIEDSSWEPAIRVWLVVRQPESQMERSVATLAGRYRRTVIWNLVVILAVSAAVVIALVQMRRRVRAEAVAEHERRVRDLERGLLHSERLASVGRFAAGVAHEVNNPLEGMGNYLTLLESDLESGDTARARQWLGRTREGLDRAAAIVRRVLSFSDPARSPKEVLPVVEPVREAIEFLQPRFPTIDIELVATDRAAVVYANRVALSQLFLNLLLNGCESQEKGGRMDVEISEEDAMVVVTITDRGRGLTEEALDHLFEPFYSTRGSSGLGLAVCHGIVQEHGGEITAANSAEGTGAVFQVRLPEAPTTEETGQ